MHYIKQVASRNATLDAREDQAGAAYSKLVGALGDAKSSMTTAAPPLVEVQDGGKGGRPSRR